MSKTIRLTNILPPSTTISCGKCTAYLVNAYGFETAATNPERVMIGKVPMFVYFKCNNPDCDHQTSVPKIIRQHPHYAVTFASQTPLGKVKAKIAEEVEKTRVWADLPRGSIPAGELQVQAQSMANSKGLREAAMRVRRTLKLNEWGTTDFNTRLLSGEDIYLRLDVAGYYAMRLEIFLNKHWDGSARFERMNTVRTYLYHFMLTTFIEMNIDN